jgi:hypothetical protein
MLLTQKDLALEPFIVTGKKLVALVIYEAIMCKTYPTLPRKIDAIVNKVTDLYKSEFKRVTDDFYFKEFGTYDEIYSWLEKHLLAILEIEELNLDQEEFDLGIGVHDENRQSSCLSSRYTKTCPPEKDFVDLDAYIRNICHDIICDHINVDFSSFK